jgi:hypothetical protein
MSNTRKFPRPPGLKEALPPIDTSKPPEITTVNGRLEDDEVSYILKITLKPHHHDDPNVLRFISNYLRCRDARQAAIEAGLDPRSGPNLRNRPDIYLAITKLTERSVSKYGFDATEVMERVKEIAAVDPVEFEREDGSYKNKLSEMSPEVRRAIKRFKVKNLFETDPNGMKIIVGEVIEVELYDKLTAVKLMGTEKDLFVEKKRVEHDIGRNMGELLLESARRGQEREVRELTGAVTPDVLEDLRNKESD